MATSEVLIGRTGNNADQVMRFNAGHAEPVFKLLTQYVLGARDRANQAFFKYLNRDEDTEEHEAGLWVDLECMREIFSQNSDDLEIAEVQSEMLRMIQQELCQTPFLYFTCSGMDTSFFFKDGKCDGDLIKDFRRMNADGILRRVGVIQEEILAQGRRAGERQTQWGVENRVKMSFNSWDAQNPEERRFGIDRNYLETYEVIRGLMIEVGLGVEKLRSCLGGTSLDEKLTRRYLDRVEAAVLQWPESGLGKMKEEERAWLSREE